MIQNRMLHIIVLAVAMAIGASLGAHAKSIHTSYGVDRFAGSAWRIAPTICKRTNTMARKTICLQVAANLTVTTLTGAGMALGAISAVAVNGAPRSIELHGGPFNADTLSTCKYDHFTRGRMYYWFEISWGDGTVSNLQSGPDGESCADIGHHTYANPGTYKIEVYIGTLGNADQMVPLYRGATVVVVMQ